MSVDSSFGPGTCIGLVGLGLVGNALAKRLKLAGYVCIGFDVRPEAMRVFESFGFETADTVSQMLNRSNTMVLAVFDTAGVGERTALVRKGLAAQRTLNDFRSAPRAEPAHQTWAGEEGADTSLPVHENRVAGAGGRKRRAYRRALMYVSTSEY